MKKITLIIIAVLMGSALDAQISVWDGTAERWTHGSGTEDDPYLIENAQQLAYIAEKTNENVYNGVNHRTMYVDTCFLLTVDLDLGGENGLEWEPIAQDGISLQTRCFGGHFDGGYHTISNMNIKDGSGRKFIGLFGHIEDGSIKNITINGANIDLPSFHLLGIPGGLGILVGYGKNVTVDHCFNNVSMVFEYGSFEFGSLFGGLFGRMENSTITDCHNNGNMTILEVKTNYSGLAFGGICGSLYECNIDYCSNQGNLFITQSGNNNFAEGEFCGGIVGIMSGSMTNCYNTGYLEMNVAINEPSSFIATASGGLVGSTMSEKDLSVTNSYSATDINITGENIPSFIGGIIGYKFDDAQAVSTNCYYLDIIESDNEYGTPQSEAFMKTQDFVNLLNANGDFYAMDIMNVNKGYPVFERYYSVEETDFANGISVYPNPAKDVVNITFSNNAKYRSIDIYSIDGRLMKSQNDSFNKINIANLTSGLYLIKVRMSDGKEFTEKIVVK